MNLLAGFGLWGYLGVALVSGAVAGGAAYKVTAWAKDEQISHLKLADAKAQSDALIRNDAIVQKAIDNGFRIASAEVAKEQKTQTVTNTIVREIPRYVSPETDSRYPVPWSVVRLHDAAALGLSASEITAARSGPDGAASDVKDSEISSVIAENYGTCRQALDRVKALQEDDTQIRAILNAAETGAGE